MKTWYIPDWSGDFRLEADGEEKCILTVNDPTPSEWELLGTFLKKARRKKWIDDASGIVKTGETNLHVAAPVAKAGLLLIDEKKKGLLTAIKSVSGKVTAVWENMAEAVSQKDADAATTVRRPTLSCPNPITGPEVRASEVLKTFCTPSQWAEWEANGYLHCYGGLTGKLYRVVHRHHPLAAKQTKSVWDVEAGRAVHAYDWSVPPPEEVLTMKLVLEHREDWIRNASGTYDYTDGMKFRHPFMSEEEQGRDGIADAHLIKSAGLGLASAIAMGGDEVLVELGID